MLARFHVVSGFTTLFFHIFGRMNQIITHSNLVCEMQTNHPAVQTYLQCPLLCQVSVVRDFFINLQPIHNGNTDGSNNVDAITESQPSGTLQIMGFVMVAISTTIIISHNVNIAILYRKFATSISKWLIS